MRRPFLLMVLLLPLPSLAANRQDTTSGSSRKIKKPLVSFVEEKQILRSDSLVYSPIDTGLYRLHIYNPVYSEVDPHRFLGNLASASEPLVYPVIKPVAPSVGYYQLRPYEYTFESIRSYNARKRFTELFYVTGAKREQVFELVHTQNVLPELNLGLGLRRMTIEGRLSRQFTYVNNINAFGKYRTRNGKYSVWGSAVLNRIDNDENGGLVDDRALDQAGGGRLAKNFRVNLGAGVNAETRWKQKSFYLSQFYTTGTDTVPGDRAKLRFGHSVLHETRGFVYGEQNPDNGFYKNIYRDTNVASIDTVSLRDFSNEFSLLSFSRIADARVYYRYQVLGYSQGTYNGSYQPSADTVWNNSFAGAELAVKLGNLRVSGQGRYGVRGYNSGDFFAQVGLESFLGKHKAGLYTFSELVSPDIIVRYYSGNHFRWDNSFSKTSSAGLGGVLDLPGLRSRLEATYTLLANVIGYDTRALPFQFRKTFPLLQVRFAKDFRLGYWGLDNRTIYQHAGTDMIRVPEFITWHSLYYERKIFGNALLIRTGTELRFVSAFLGNAYMPATGQFFRQNDRLVEGYPVLDFFVNFKIKSARIFLRLEQFNSGLTPGTYFQVPGYPMPGRILKFGLSWRFFD
jgi:hypothetical protein